MFTDNFDRGGPTQTIGTPWDDVNATGDWWINASTHAKYPNDSALWELSGTGEIIGPKIPQNDDGYMASYDIIDELEGNIYRIIFGAPEDAGRPNVPPLPGCACIIVEYEVGELTSPVTYTSAIRIYTRSATGVETLVKEKYFPPQAVNSQDGRRFYAHWLNTHQDNTFCAWIGSSAYNTHLTVVGLAPPGRYFGAANASGSDLLPIEIDDYELQVATWEDQNGTMQPCFVCTCVCYDYYADDPDTYPTPIDRKLYPGILTVRFQGECCTPIPIFWPCGTCKPATDETFTVEYDEDIELAGLWYNHDDLTICGYPFQFRFECDGNGILTFQMYYKPYLGAEWQNIVMGAAYTLTRQQHSCTPIYQLWRMTLGSLSGFPCCLSCTTGEYTIEVTA